MSEAAKRFTPLYDRLLIREVPKPEKIGNIYVPDNVRLDGPLHAEVLAVGHGTLLDDGYTLIPLDVRPGDKVMMPPFAGTEIEIDNEKFRILREYEVLGLIE